MKCPCPASRLPRCPHPLLAGSGLALLVLAGASLLPLDAVLAQTGGTERVAQEIARTEEILRQTREVVEESDSARARRILEEAVSLHQRSHQELMAGRPVLAMQLTQRARQAARHAAQIARDELGFEERARLRIERLRDLHEQLFERAGEERNQRALQFIRQAEKQVLRAREQYAQHNFEMALNLLDTAESVLQRAARLLFESGGAQRLELELQRTRALLDRTRERASAPGNPQASELLGRAEQSFRLAQEALARAEPVSCMQALRRARRQAGQAAALASGGPTEKEVQAQIDRWDQRQARIAPRIAEEDRLAVRRLLERATRHRRAAGRMLADGDGEGALRQIKIAHDLLQEAGEKAR